MHVMGVDPGIANTGLVLLYESEGSICSLGDQLAQTKPAQPLTERISVISEKIRSFIIDFKPSHMFVEEVFFARNRSSASTTSMVIGTCAYLAHIHNVKFDTVKPNEVKKVLTGKIKASKIEVADAVMNKVLHLDSDSHHVTDAAAIAFTGMYKLENEREED